GGGLARTAYELPLHPGPEHQARPLRAVRPSDGREVGNGPWRLAGLPEHRVHLRLEHSAHRPAALDEAFGMRRSGGFRGMSQGEASGALGSGCHGVATGAAFWGRIVATVPWSG